EDISKNDNAENEDESAEGVVSALERKALQEEVKRAHGKVGEGKPQPTARVVGIIKRNWRQYVGHIDKDSVKTGAKQSRAQ
nr:hypothetical protein [Tanacetum cinerariifolium]